MSEASAGSSAGSVLRKAIGRQAAASLGVRAFCQRWSS